MKVKVKGLVFVGFAAAILSANAALADPDNTVTSKAYVDNKFQTIGNIAQDLTATGDAAAAKYPSVAAVKTALSDNGGQVYNSTMTITQNGVTAGSFTANQSSNSSVAIAAPDWNAASDEAGFIANKPTVDTTFNAASTNAATSAAIADYVGTQLTSNQADWAETTTTDPSYIQNKPTQLSQFTDNIDAENVLNGVKVNGTALNIDTTDKTVNLGAAAGKGVDTDFTDTTSTDVPTTAAVADYVGTQLTSNQADWAETTTTDPSYIQNKPTQLSQFTDNIDAENAIDSITVGGTAVTPDSNKAVALGAAAGKGADTTITSSASDNNVPTSKAVYDYVDALPAADIPVMPNTCTAAAPCVLTNDTTSGALTWVPIQQAE